MNEIQRRKKETNYLRWISKIIDEDVKNANIGYTNVIDVRLSNDGSHLKVYVLFDRNEKRSIETLNNIKGFIRSELSKYDSSKRVPELSFEIDEVSKHSARIDELLRKIKDGK